MVTKGLLGAVLVSMAGAVAFAQTPQTPPAMHVATLVEVATPAGVTRPMLEEGFRRSVPTYQAVPGLIRKYFTANETTFGGMYLWTDRAAAEAWFTPQWAAQCAARYHTECRVTYFDTPLQIDGKAAP